MGTVVTAAVLSGAQSGALWSDPAVAAPSLMFEITIEKCELSGTRLTLKKMLLLYQPQRRNF